MSTYNVHAGHSLVCRGASGLLDEVNEDRKVKNKVIELLRKEGHTVYMIAQMMSGMSEETWQILSISAMRILSIWTFQFI